MPVRCCKRKSDTYTVPRRISSLVKALKQMGQILRVKPLAVILNDNLGCGYRIVAPGSENKGGFYGDFASGTFDKSIWGEGKQGRGS